jgi:hypothetical protein
VVYCNTCFNRKEHKCFSSSTEVKIKLWVDDERNEPLGWLRVSDYDNAIDALTTYNRHIVAISFDYDIGISGNGALVAGYAEKLAKKGNLSNDVEFNIHSGNPQGCINIKATLERIMRFWGRKSEEIHHLKASEMWDKCTPGWRHATKRGRMKTRRVTGL